MFEGAISNSTSAFAYLDHIGIKLCMLEDDR